MSRKPPNVNASLIREGRMIFQQLQQMFGGSGKVDNYYAMRAAEAQAKAQQKTPALVCVFCFRLRSKPMDAVTIANGQAVCGDHMFYVQSGEFGRIRDIIQQEEKRS